jgi:predicted NBD/HSP70 family sugar kinase
VIQAWQQHEPWAVQIVDAAMDQLALSLSHAYNLLDLETVVLGGGVITGNFPDLDDLMQRVEPLVYPQIRPITIRRGLLADRAVLTGAALLAFDHLGDDQL